MGFAVYIPFMAGDATDNRPHCEGLDPDTQCQESNLYRGVNHSTPKFYASAPIDPGPGLSPAPAWSKVVGERYGCCIRT